MSLAAKAQQQSKVWRIGYVHLRAGPSEREEAFVAALARLGYVEGRNLAIVSRWTSGALDRLPDIMAELVALGVDAIVASSVQATAAARWATRTIPIVMSGVPDPAGSGLIASLARPGANVTGVSTTAADLSPKRLELLRELLPDARRIGIITSAAVGGVAAADFKPLTEAARRLKLDLIVEIARNADELLLAIETIQHKGGQGLLLFRLAPFAIDLRKPLVTQIARQRLPAVFEIQEHVNAGGLMCYGYNVSELYSRAASYLDKIFKGAKPADLPVEQPTRFELVINMQAAKQIGIRMPQSLLLRADRVIE
jgi:putative ABC transport system substrate-binding protein